MSEWKKVKLKELIKEVNERNKGEKIKRVLSVTNSLGFVEQKEYFERNIHSTNTSNYKIINRNQFAFNPSRVNVGSIDLLKKYDVGILSPMYVVFEVDRTKIIPEYLNYYFQTYIFLENVKKNTQGSVRESLSFNDLLKFDFLLPTINEQKKIIYILDKIDKILINYSEKITKCNDERKYIKKKIFNLLNKKCTVKKKISELFERITEKNENMKSNNILTISAQEGLVNQFEYFNKIVAGENLEKYYILKKNDFAYNKSYSNGYPVGATKMLKKYHNGIVSTLYICFRSKSPMVHNGFFEYLFQSKEYYKELEKITQEGNRNHGILNMNVNDFFNIKVIVPEFEMQNKIYNILFRIDNKIELLKSKQIQYEKLKKGLMQKLLTGKVKVNV